MERTTTNNYHEGIARELRRQAVKTLNLAHAHREKNDKIEALEHRRLMLETYLTTDGETEPPAP